MSGAGGEDIPATQGVHVWRVSLEQGERAVSQLCRGLVDGELERARRFRGHTDGRDFVVCRGFLRRVLGHYLGMHPAQVPLRHSMYGKPYVECLPGGPAVSFNVSHSGRLALIAVADGRDVGVDIEVIRSLPQAEDLADRFFSPREARALRAVAPEQRPQAFFTCWTRKEAFLKAQGTGLRFPLDRFDVSLTPGTARLLRLEGGDAERWSLCDLRPVEGYAGALAIAGPVGQVEWRNAGVDLQHPVD